MSHEPSVMSHEINQSLTISANTFIKGEGITVTEDNH